jgi:hypothetical protein
MIAAALLIAASVSQPVRLYGCKMDECWWHKEQATASVLRTREGQLLRYVTLDGSSSHPDDKYPERYSRGLHVRFSKKTTYVFCSTSSPSIAFHSGEPGRGEWLGHMLDLYDLYGYNSWSAVTYLRACHHQDLGRAAVDGRLQRLGYRRGTPNMQIKLRKPTDLADGSFIKRTIAAADQ